VFLVGLDLGFLDRAVGAAMLPTPVFQVGAAHRVRAASLVRADGRDNPDCLVGPDGPVRAASPDGVASRVLAVGLDGPATAVGLV